MRGKRKNRSVILVGLLIVGLSTVSCRLIYLQVIKSEYYVKKSKNTFLRKKVIQANRGFIVDRNDEVMAKSVIFKSVKVNKNHLRDHRVISGSLAYNAVMRNPERESMTKRERRRLYLAALRLIKKNENKKELSNRYIEEVSNLMARPLGMTATEMVKKIDIWNKPDEKVLVKAISYDVAVSLEGLIDEQRIKGFYLSEKKSRWYPSNNLASHLIGYINSEGKSISGLEKTLNYHLEGKNGREERMYDSVGRVLPAHKGGLVAPVNGNNVQLTIDMSVQAICEEELHIGMQKYLGKKGCAIVMEVNSGDVLALASYPSYDLNTKENIEKAEFNYAVQAVYEPGSVMKIVAATAALEEGHYGLESLIDCHDGKYKENGVVINEPYNYKKIPFWKVMQKSSNIGVFMMAKSVGRKKFFEYAENFGFGYKTGIRIFGEKSGRLRDTGNDFDFSRVTFGYGLHVTPLQVINAYASLANGGLLLNPQIVRTVTTNKGEIVEQRGAEIVRRVCSKKVSKAMLKSLQVVVSEEGTAKNAQIENLEVGGKTGTAKKYDAKSGKHFEDRYTVSFVGIFPIKKPKYVCLVVVDDPQTTKVKRYGGTVAAPIWKNIVTRMAARLNLESS